MTQIKMDVSKKTTEIFNKIATWHNGDEEEPSKSNLMILSHEIVEDLMNFAVSELEAKTKLGIEFDQDALKNTILNDMKKKQPKKPKKLFGLF